MKHKMDWVVMAHTFNPGLGRQTGSKKKKKIIIKTKGKRTKVKAQEACADTYTQREMPARLIYTQKTVRGKKTVMPRQSFLRQKASKNAIVKKVHFVLAIC